MLFVLRRMWRERFTSFIPVLALAACLCQPLVTSADQQQKHEDLPPLSLPHPSTNAPEAREAKRSGHSKDKLYLPPELADVLRLVKAGISDDVVIAYVKKAPFEYPVNADDLVELKNLGVPGVPIVPNNGQYPWLPVGTQPGSGTAPPWGVAGEPITPNNGANPFLPFGQQPGTPGAPFGLAPSVPRFNTFPVQGGGFRYLPGAPMLPNAPIWPSFAYLGNWPYLPSAMSAPSAPTWPSAIQFPAPGLQYNLGGFRGGGGGFRMGGGGHGGGSGGGGGGGHGGGGGGGHR